MILGICNRGETSSVTHKVGVGEGQNPQGEVNIQQLNILRVFFSFHLSRALEVLLKLTNLTLLHGNVGGAFHCVRETTQTQPPDSSIHPKTSFCFSASF